MIPITTIPVGRRDLERFLNGEAGSRERLASTFKRMFCVDHVLFFNSGRTALMTALQEAAKHGDRICLPAYTCPILFDVILSSGMQPVPVDVEYETMSFGKELAEAAKKEITGVVAVHLFGDPISMQATRDAIARETFLIEDCAQSLGAFADSSPVGTQGDYSIFSFGIGKTITAGIGGALASRGEVRSDVQGKSLRDTSSAFFNLFSMLVGSRPATYSIAYPILKALREKSDEGQAIRISRKIPYRFAPNRLPEGCCRVLITQLAALDEVIEQRRKHARMLTDLLSDNQLRFGLSRQALEQSSTFTRYVVRVPSSTRTPIMRALNKGGFEAEVPYPSLARFLPSYGEFPTTKRLLVESLALPVHGGMSENDVQRMAMIIRRAR